MLLLGGFGLWYLRSLPRPVDLRAGPGEEASPTAGPAPSPSTILVHVAGRVKRPGVYELHDGDRVIDAIQAAGGPRKDAYLDALNLAAPLADGQQVLVPRLVPGGPGGTVGTVGPGPPGLVNVNTASAAELEALPGIGPVLAQRIVDHRTEHGPFGAVDDLLSVSGIGEATLAELRDLVTV